MSYLDDNTTFWSDQVSPTAIAAAVAMLAAIDAAILALLVGGVKNYRLSTGQTDQSVTKLDLPNLQQQKQALRNFIATADARVNGGTIQVVPNS